MKTLFEYLRETYGFNNNEITLNVFVYDEDCKIENCLFHFTGTPKEILKNYTFYDLEMMYVQSHVLNNIIVEK